MGSQIIKIFYSCTIESLLTGFIFAWYINCKALDYKALQRVVSTAQYINRAELLAIQDRYTRRSEEGPKYCQTPATQAKERSFYYRIASGTSAPSLEPTGP